MHVQCHSCIFSVISKMATGYMGGGIKAPLVNLGWDAPAGQMYSTINDLLKAYINECTDYLRTSYVALKLS